jgi:hypothetical protein
MRSKKKKIQIKLCKKSQHIPTIQHKNCSQKTTNDKQKMQNQSNLNFNKTKKSKGIGIQGPVS